MSAVPIDVYVAQMKEIKRRIALIDNIASTAAEPIPDTTFEILALQFRKVFELIAFASLAAHKKEYSTVYTDFSKHWEAAKLIKNLKRINSKFYPQPVYESEADVRGVAHDLKPRATDYLTEGELIAAHGRCASLLHATNPFAKPVDFEFYKVSIFEWRIRIINLLNNHQINLPGDTGFYLLHMQEEGTNEVRWYRFEKIGPISEWSCP